MTGKKKIFIIFVVMLCILTGCGGQDDSGGSTAIYYYDFETESADMFMLPLNKSEFLSEGRDYVVRCIYAYDYPRGVSGEFYQRQGDEVGRCSITELYTTNDLFWLKELRGGCAVGYTAKGKCGFKVGKNSVNSFTNLIPHTGTCKKL